MSGRIYDLKKIIFGAAGFLLGFISIWHGFELVSVPDYKEFHEPVFAVMGLVLMAAGVYGVYSGLKKK